MCSVGYFATPNSAEEEESIRRIAEGEVGLIQSFPLIRRPEHWVVNADGSTVREKWMDFLKEYEFLGL
jgi:hypothetical protein